MSTSATRIRAGAAATPLFRPSADVTGNGAPQAARHPAGRSIAS
jgi:hypothetical protein